MRCGEAHVSVELVFKLLQMRQSCPNDQTAKGMTNKANPSQARNWTERLDVIFYFLCKAFSQLHNIAFCLTFIGATRQEDSVRVHY